MSDDRLLWIDVETVGLGALSTELLEIGWLFTDWSITPDWSTAKHYPIMREKDYDMRDVFPPHMENGLINATKTGGLPLDVVLDMLHDDITGMVSEHRVMLAGSSVGFDKHAIEAHYPGMFSDCHHHLIDFSVLNEVYSAWNPSINATVPVKITDHRVMTCLHGSIALAQRYRDIITQASAF